MNRFNLMKVIQIRCEVVLGVIFLVASYEKIKDPPDFAHMIYNYKLTPGGLINLMAIFMPWVECLAGLGLITGVWRRGAAALVTAMLVMFISALTYNYVDNFPVDCGCFSVIPKNLTPEEMLADMRWRILEDAGMLLAALLILADRFRKQPRSHAQPQPAA
jgi:uncharacterized membrane protein YphA (DoxX/SURF4 family)